MQRATFLLMVFIMIILVTVLFGVLGKGEYQPPTSGEQGYVSVFLA